MPLFTPAMQLFTDIAPKTSENFRALCTGNLVLFPFALNILLLHLNLQGLMIFLQLCSFLFLSWIHWPFMIDGFLKVLSWFIEGWGFCEWENLCGLVVTLYANKFSWEVSTWFSNPVGPSLLMWYICYFSPNFWVVHFFRRKRCQP